jgi:hypothetical protein
MLLSLRLSLALLVTRVVANHVQFAVPLDQLAVFTNTFDTRAHLHVRFSRQKMGKYDCSEEKSGSKWKIIISDRATAVAAPFLQKELGEGIDQGG